jgi:glycosyltransferase involved in cell wall biosynthesis
MLSLCIIVKNEAKTLPTLFKSIVEHVDQVVVTDTGSTDNTKEVCEKWCGEKLKWTEYDWTDDFSAARTYNFSEADGDWIVWADADDEIIDGQFLKTNIEKAEKHGVNAILFPYHYVVDEHGNTKVLQMRERLIKNNGTYTWIGRLHEAMLPVSKIAKAIRLQDVQWFHRTNEERILESTQRNVRILELAIEEEIKADAVDPRTLYNLGNSYFTIDEYVKAIGCYQKYIPLSGWDAEKYLAQHRTSLALYKMGEYDKAIEHALLATTIEPTYPDAYIDLAKVYFHKEEYNKALHWSLIASQMEFPEDLPAVNPLDYSVNLDYIMAHCYVQTGAYRKAIPLFERYQRAIPDNETVVGILATLKEGIQESEEIQTLANTAKILKEDMPWDKVPSKYMEYPELAVLRNQTILKPESTGRDIAIYCGKSPTIWDSTSETTGGIGGSEEAVINMARLLAQKEWNVTVFGRPITPGVQDGVVYKNFTDYNPRDKWDILIGWRMPAVFNVEHNASQKYLWLHDVTTEDSFSPESLQNIDKIFVLSEFHRNLLPSIPDEKFVLSGNGLNPYMFNGKGKKNPMYCINTSAADRGLECLLKMWSKIREQVPKAELHWFYGWEVYDKFHSENPERMAWKASIQELLKQPGVFEEGRVDHVTIAKKYEQAQLWLYPTEFSEIYCITADKAQAGGALPVTTKVGALDERVKYGTMLDVKDIYTNEEAQKEFIDTTVEYLKSPDTVELERKGMSDYALKECTWDRIATQWDSLFTS